MSEQFGRVVSTTLVVKPTEKQVRDYDRYLARRFLTRWQYAVWCVRDWFR